MGFFDRIENIIKSYLNDEDRGIFGRDAGWSENRDRSQRYRFFDPDAEAAFEELNDFLNRDGETGGFRETTGFGRAGAGDSSAPPESLRTDFAELGLRHGASPEECRIAYKELLKIHHPDRHAKHPGNFKKAT